MRFIYVIVLFFSSLLLADIGAFQLFTVGTAVYFIDFLFFFFLLCFGIVGIKTGMKFYGLNRSFVIFLGVLLFSILYGSLRYGFSAIGEGRYIYWIFFLAVPLYFYLAGFIRNLRDFDKIFKISYILIITNVLILLAVEIAYGGRFFLAPENREFARLEDERGLRYLGSEESFHLGVGVIFLLIDQYINKRKRLWKTIAILVLTGLILFTKNRTAIIGLFLSFVVVFALEGKAKLILKILAGGAISLGLAFLLFPSATQSVLEPIQKAFNITQDETGSWRLLVQAVAIRQSLETPILGQGFGGYFEYYVEELGGVVNYPPHSIYIYLFQKSGLVGLLSYLIGLGALIRESTRLKKFTADSATAEKYRLLFKVLLIAQIPYGFAYNFSTYLGFYIGMLIVLKNLVNKPALQPLPA
ncbi:MAG TPA: O-antigen ligase family protein [Flavisolibacter sp.]|nr:O-antigen ligase family protein [Flavisolibacter sp.]